MVEEEASKREGRVAATGGELAGAEHKPARGGGATGPPQTATPAKASGWRPERENRLFIVTLVEV